ncbi:MAG: hypothetical protein J3Q66DRAFT_435511 [Benniella sp.]|nr:MAG: hypothetical protein J3Q66DRAFT_435511 [Benniella sp.]
MPPSLSSNTIITLLAFALSLLSSVFLIHPVLAQGLRPAPNHAACSAFIEGQGFYILGGRGDDNFMIDLSVSWNTSDPVFKKLEGGPRTMGNPCATTNDELFMLVEGTGYVYNVSSDTWRVVHNSYFDLVTRIDADILGAEAMAAADPETGIVYLPDLSFRKMLSVNLRTNAYELSNVTIYADEGIQVVAWNSHLKSMVVEHALYPMNLFTPSKVSKSSTGWSKLEFPRPQDIPTNWACGVPAHGGTKMVYYAEWVYVLDVVKKTWTRGPPGPGVWRTSCAISGDQFILWGGLAFETDTTSNKTSVFNIKTMKWTSGYIAPPSRSNSTATTHASQPWQPSQTPTQNVPQTTTTTGNPTDIKLLVIIVVAIGVLLAINVWFIFRYQRRDRRSNQRTSPNGLSTDPLDYDTDISAKGHSFPHQRDPSDSGRNPTRLSSDHDARSKWNMSDLLGRTQQGSVGARELSEHPHAIVEDPTARRNLQEGALEVQLFSQHPHAMVGDRRTPTTPMHSDKVIQGYNRHCGDKEELGDQ